MKKEAEAEISRAKEVARERVLLDFEKGQLYTNPAVGTTTSGSDSKDCVCFCLVTRDLSTNETFSSRHKTKVRI